MSMVTGPSASSAARSAGSRPVIRAVAAARPASAPCQCLAVNRRASPVAVEVASPGTGVTCCPAASARSRSRPTRKSSPASWAAAIPASTCPPVNPRARCLTGPIASSRASIRPSLPHSSVTASIPPAAVSDGSAAPICIRPRVLACLPDAITIPVTCFLRDSGAVTPYHPRNNKLSREPAVACRRSTHGFGSEQSRSASPSLAYEPGCDQAVCLSVHNFRAGGDQPSRLSKGVVPVGMQVQKG